MNFKGSRFGLIIFSLFISVFCNAGDIVIKNNASDKVITFGNSKIAITLDYNGKCTVSALDVNGQSDISRPAGIFSAITTSSNTYSTLKLTSAPTLRSRAFVTRAL